MKKITATQLKSILNQHQLWLDGNGGICADLTGANLVGASLRSASLTVAILTGANLSDANLKDANLYYADLRGANLTGTILEKKSEKQPEVASVNAESMIRSEIEAIAKKHGMKVASLTLELL